MSRGGALDIAIVGMGCRFPGAPDLFAYWEDVLAGRRHPHDSAAPVDPERFLATDAATFALADAGLTPDDLHGRRLSRFRDDPESIRPDPWCALEQAVRALADREADLAAVGDASVEAAVILKRRADAEREGDRIYAVVQDLLNTESPMLGAAMFGEGLAGLIEAALALYHRALPPTQVPRAGHG